MPPFPYTAAQMPTATAYFDEVSLYGSDLAVNNFSFEDTNGSGLPLNWRYTGDNTGFISGSTIRAYDGSRSLKFNDTSASEDAFAESDEIAVVPANQYVARSKCYIESGTANLYIEFFNASGTRISYEDTGLTVTGSWQSMSVIGKAPANACTARVGVYSNPSNTGICYFDQVSLNAEWPWVENSSFEYTADNGIPVGWTLLGDNIGFFSGSTTRADDGIRSMKISDTSANEDALARSNKHIGRAGGTIHRKSKVLS